LNYLSCFWWALGTPSFSVVELNGWIPVGGQVDFSSYVGDNLMWKKVQKNDTNKIPPVHIMKA